MIESPQRERTIQEYRYLCVRGARKFMREGVDRRDLEQVAAIGLIKATDRFDPALGTPFEAYAWTLVLGELMHYVRDAEHAVRAPRRLRELERRCIAAERAFFTEHGREAVVRELAEALGVEEAVVREIQQFRGGRFLSVEALRPYEQLALSYTIDGQLERVTIAAVLEALSPVEREIVRGIYESDVPIGELAERLGYSRRHINRLHQGALRKLRASEALSALGE